MTRPFTYFDALYGDVTLSSVLGDLAQTPAVQRLRDIRLSNIDSLSMPGIANISRFEHALGSSFLATSINRGSHMTDDDSMTLAATAMLHDAAITGFGHLVEEALQYADTGFDHEEKLNALLFVPDKAHLGGLDLQIYQGRQAGLYGWAERCFGNSASERIVDITQGLHGIGRWGQYISSDVDLDNLDNLVRIAYHMGLPVDRELPLRIARGMTPAPTSGAPVFAESAVSLIEQWLALRHAVYARLMLSRSDFVGKSMLLFAVITAYQDGDLGLRQQAWTLTDRSLLNALAASRNPEVSRTLQSWLTQELWPLGDLLWFDGAPPPFPKVMSFCDVASTSVDRMCFAYRINDKRVRRITLNTETRNAVEMGTAPTQWLLGISSRKREPFTRSENDQLRELASEFFNSRCLGLARTSEPEPARLFG